MEIGSLLRDRRGEVFFSSAVKIMLAALVLAVLMSIFHVYYTIGAVREKVNESVLAVASANIAEFYGGAREGDGFARHYEGGTYASAVSSDDVLETLSQSVGASTVDDAGEITVRSSYSISMLQTSFVNSTGNVLNFKTTLTVTVPLKLAGITVPISKDILVRSSYDPKF